MSISPIDDKLISNTIYLHSLLARRSARVPPYLYIYIYIYIYMYSME